MISASQAQQITLDSHTSLMTRLDNIVRDTALRGLSACTTTINLTDEAISELQQLGYTIRHDNAGFFSFYSISWK